MFCKSLKEINLIGIVEINRKAFSDCYSLKRIEISYFTQNIDNYAFYNCINLEEVVFDQSSRLEQISIGTFQNCIHLSSVTLPPELGSIMDFAFANTSLKEIRISFLRWL